MLIVCDAGCCEVRRKGRWGQRCALHGLPLIHLESMEAYERWLEESAEPPPEGMH